MRRLPGIHDAHLVFQFQNNAFRRFLAHPLDAGQGGRVIADHGIFKSRHRHAAQDRKGHLRPDAGHTVNQQAEKILVEDAGGVFLFWARVAQFWRPYLKGKSLEPSKDGIVAFRGTKLGLTHYTIYVTTDREPLS